MCWLRPARARARVDWAKGSQRERSSSAILISDPHQRSSSAIIVEGWVRAREEATRKHAQAGIWLLGAGTLTTPSCKRVARFVADGLLHKPFATVTQKRMCGGT